MRALIVGAGIAGPVVGSFLRRLGMDVQICESRTEAESTDGLAGAFLGVAPNGMNVLRHLGADRGLLEVGTPNEGFAFHNARGQRIATIDGREDAERYGSRLVILKRSDLHATLLDTARREGVDVRFGARLEELDRSDPRVVVARFEDGREEVADFVIGCDGIRSRTRALALPESPEPEFLGMLDFGGFTRGVDAPIEVGWNVMTFGKRAFFGAFKRPDGEIWWFHNGGDQHPLRELPASERIERILALHEGDPKWIQDVVRGSSRLLGPWPLHDLATMPSWHAGRVCVIGDAAHAISPSAGQGASLAMEDAMLLARCLRDERDPERAFAKLESLRRSRVETIIQQARRNGSGKVASSALSAWMRDRMLPFFLKLGASAQREQYGYRIDWDAAA